MPLRYNPKLLADLTFLQFYIQGAVVREWPLFCPAGVIFQCVQGNELIFGSELLFTTFQLYLRVGAYNIFNHYCWNINVKQRYTNV